MDYRGFSQNLDGVLHHQIFRLQAKVNRQTNDVEFGQLDRSDFLADSSGFLRLPGGAFICSWA